MRPPARLTQLARRRRSRIALDVALLVGFIAEFVTREGPDYTLHSWIGIVLVPVLAIHLTGNWQWIRRVWRNATSDREWPLARFNLAFGAVTAVCIATGFPVWLDWSTTPWTTAHTVTGFAAILLMFSHLWRNRTRISALVGRRPRSAVS